MVQNGSQGKLVVAKVAILRQDDAGIICDKY